MNDIDALCLKVREPESRRLIGDAINAYRGGAFRSAIISTWIAVVYDIFAKARELASQGNSAAQRLVAELDKAIETQDVGSMQRIERQLLEAAEKELLLFGAREAVDLKRVETDRHQCAHPAFVAGTLLFQPTPELVRNHLVYALVHVLTQAPVQGKSAIARVHQDILSPSFPTDPARIATFLRTKYLEQANSALLENLAKSFLAAPFGEDHEMYTGKQRLLAAALKAVSEFNPGTFEPVASDYCARRFSNVSDELLLRLCSYLDALPLIWSWLPESDRIRIQELLQKVDEEVLKDNHAFDALAVPEVQKTLRSRFSGLKTASKIDVIAEHPRREFKDDAIELFGDSWSFAEAQIWGEKLILPASRFLDADDVRTILLKAEHNDQIRSSPGMPDVLARLFDATRDLLPHTRAHWQAFVDSMTKQNKDDQTARYSYPKIRSLLESADTR